MSESFLETVKKAIRDYRQKRFQTKQALKGYTDGLNEIQYVDLLSDADLVRLNGMLKWNCFTVDRHGRRFGNAASAEKRNDPEIIPDRRIMLLNEKFDLSGKHVLEIGCLEGVHTIGLTRFAKKVTAIDARIENVVKTIVRCAFFGCYPTVLKCNVEERPLPVDLLRADLVYHVGVLYHLKDPIHHLTSLREFIRQGILMDTHYALDDEANESYDVLGRKVRYKRYLEGGYFDPFSGMYVDSKCLRLEDIVDTLNAAGFGRVDVIEASYSERLGSASIGIGAAVTRRPLPHHRAYGSVHGGSSQLR